MEFKTRKRSFKIQLDGGNPALVKGYSTLMDFGDETNHLQVDIGVTREDRPRYAGSTEIVKSWSTTCLSNGKKASEGPTKKEALALAYRNFFSLHARKGAEVAMRIIRDQKEKGFTQ